MPTDNIENNVKASVETFESEGDYPIINVITDSQLDNYTDALILLNATYSNDSSVVDKAISVYRPNVEGETPVEVIAEYYSDDSENSDDSDFEIISYARYWHGYLLFIKPLLTFFTYAQIRVINTVFVFGLAFVLIGIMFFKKMRRCIIPYIISLLLIDPFAISQSLQFSAVYYIFTIASIIYLLKQDWFNKSLERLVLLFVIIGCATSYFDFLTYPLATFGVPAVLYLCSAQNSFKEKAKNLLFIFIAWGFGYAGMWAGKWVLGSLIGSENIILDAVNNILTRTADVDATGESFTLFTVIKRQLTHLYAPSFLLAAAFALICIVIILANHPIKKIQNLNWVLYLAICIIPFVWYLLASNHSYIHNFFTYRELIITVFSGLCMLSFYATRKDAFKTKKLKKE